MNENSKNDGDDAPTEQRVRTRETTRKVIR